MPAGRADVLRAARELIDAEGLDGLADVTLFPTRQDLLEALAGDLLAEVADPPPAGPWDQRLITVAHRLRQALLSLRDGARLVAATPATEQAERTAAQILVDAGLAPDRAAWTAPAVIHYVVGHTIAEQRADGPDAGRRFEFGLGLMVDGINGLF